MGMAHELADQPGLADAGLTGDEDGTARPLEGLLPRQEQRLVGLGPTSEGERGRRVHETREWDERGLVRDAPVDVANGDGFGETLQFAGAHWGHGELATRTGEGAHQIAHQDLTASGVAAQSGRLDDRGAEPIAVLEGGVTGADADPHLKVPGLETANVAFDRTLHGHRLGQRIAGSLVRQHHRVTDRLDLGAAGSGDRLAQVREVLSPQLVDGHVTDSGGQLGRANEIREQDRDEARLTHLVALPSQVELPGTVCPTMRATCLGPIGSARPRVRR